MTEEDALRLIDFVDRLSKATGKLGVQVERLLGVVEVQQARIVELEARLTRDEAVLAHVQKWAP